MVYEVRGAGFLHHMVRNMVGTFILVGKGTINGEHPAAVGLGVQPRGKRARRLWIVADVHERARTIGDALQPAGDARRREPRTNGGHRHVDAGTQGVDGRDG